MKDRGNVTLPPVHVRPIASKSSNENATSQGGGGGKGEGKKETLFHLHRLSHVGMKPMER